MSKFAKLAPDIYVSGQLTKHNLDVLAENGFRAIINNRPDGEGFGYPAAFDMKEHAGKKGMAYRHLPIDMCRLHARDLDAFISALDEMPRPIVLHCASGRRSTVMWALSQATRQDADAIINACRLAGHDVSSMRPLLHELSRKKSA